VLAHGRKRKTDFTATALFASAELVHCAGYHRGRHNRFRSLVGSADCFVCYRNVADKTVFVWMQRLPVAFLLLSLLILAWCGLWALIERPLSRVQSVALACSISFIAANFINNQLKYAFGRTWPETWIQNNPSLIQSGVFGFNPFHGGPGFASFPSGHVAAVCAVITVLWWSYPNLRPIYAACVAAVAVGLIGANYHFLSDIIAGIFVGISVGYITTKISGGKLISESSSPKLLR
jgi:membrane-associated phospholipid phosphatase